MQTSRVLEWFIVVSWLVLQFLKTPRSNEIHSPAEPDKFESGPTGTSADIAGAAAGRHVSDLEPMRGIHSYAVQVVWTGNRGSGTSNYRAYDRAHEIRIANKPTILGSAEPLYRGDPTRHNPEELLVAALSACHMLWFLHLAADAGIVVTEYRDDATGRMEDTTNGGGRFTEVVLRPIVVTSEPADETIVNELHHRSHDLCYIASSVNFPVRCEPSLAAAVPA